jgi:ribulose 1,5-bisphosphate carboxylase large subunit-like protein
MSAQSLFYPPLQVIIGSVTTSVAITAGGLALMILPTLVVGHEMLILFGGWFLAHRYGTLRGMVEAAKSAVDEPANKV